MNKSVLQISLVFFIILSGFLGYKLYQTNFRATDESLNQEDIKADTEAVIGLASQQRLWETVVPSPDGKYTLINYSYPTSAEDKILVKKIKLIENETQNIIWETPMNKAWTEAKWSPDGNYISFIDLLETGSQLFQVTPFKALSPVTLHEGMLSDYIVRCEKVKNTRKSLVKWNIL